MRNKLLSALGQVMLSILLINQISHRSCLPICGIFLDELR